MRNDLISALVAVALVTCAPVMTSPLVRHPLYQYSLLYPTDDVHPGDTRDVTWKATPAGEMTQEPPPLRLCFALIGAYPTVLELKASSQTRPTCPIKAANVVFASDVLIADATSGSDLSQQLRIPADAAPGFYNFVHVAAFADGNATSAAGIVHVVRAP